MNFKTIGQLIFAFLAGGVVVSAIAMYNNSYTLASLADFKVIILPFLVGSIFSTGIVYFYLENKDPARDKQQEYLLAALDGAPEGIILWDDNNKFLWCNEYFKALRPNHYALLSPGMSYEDFLRARLREETGLADVEERLAEFIDMYASDVSQVEEYTSGGKWISVIRKYLPTGGLISFHNDITARKHAEEILYFQEEQYRRIFEESGIAMVTSNLAGNFIRANPAFCKFLGYSEQELLNMSIFDTIFEDDRAHITINREACIKEKRRLDSFESRFVRKDGAIVWGLTNRSLVKDGDGNLVSFETQIQDITERKKNEAKAALAEQQYSQIFEQANDGVILRSTDTLEIIDCNEGLCRKLGYSKEELIGEKIARFSHSPSGLIGDDDNLDPPLDENNSFERLYVRKDGSRFPVEISRTTVNVDEKSLVLTFVRDISERKNAELLLERERVLLDEVGRISKTGGWHVELATMVLTWSTETYRIHEVPEDYKLDVEEAINFYADEDRRLISSAVEMGINEGTPWDLELSITTGKGNTKRVRAIGEVVFEDGNAVALEGTFQDITDRKKLENQLHQSQKMEAVGQLSTGIAHDFNNLLMTALGNLEFIEEGLTDDALKGYAGVAKRAVLHGAELTKRLLAFSRKQNLQPVRTDVSELVNGMEAMFRPVLPANISLKWHISSDLWPIYIDQGNLESSLLNLVLNSRDAMVAGGTMTISCENAVVSPVQQINKPFLLAGEYVAISVEDTGMGIQSSHLDKIIDPFFTTKDIGDGSGLGLSMVYGFVSQSRGIVDIESEPNVGTKVTLYLPRNKFAKTVEVAKISTVEDIPLGSGEIILVIEDEPDVREVTILQLESLGYEVIDGGDGQMVADKCFVESCIFGLGISLVLSDVVLPNKLSGPKVLDIIRDCCPAAKGLLMTGYSENSTIRSESGDLLYPVISKPFLKEELARKISAVFAEPPLK